MVFSSLTFLLIFLPTLLLCYFAVPKRYAAVRRGVLMVFSLLFYACGEPLYVFVIIACVFVTWKLSDGIAAGSMSAYLAALAVNLIPLVIFKYLNFIIYNLNLLPVVELPQLSLRLPIGISFYTFQMLTYIIDLHRGTVQKQEKLSYLLLYIFLFPQLIAGPIVRYAHVEHDLCGGSENWESVRSGAGRFVKGLVKKVIFANQTALICDTITALEPAKISVGMMWLAVAAYTMQIYFDFSGYSDMAVGLGRIFGFRFLENFRLPYSSLSVAEFWRRWHISMNTFFRDYIYIPLGGNRCSTKRWLFNIFVVWSVTGLWHGASWNFIIWGLYYAVLLVVEKMYLSDTLEKLPKAVRFAYTMLLVMIGWSFFMHDSNSLSEIFLFTGRLFGLGTVEGAATLRSLELQSTIPYLIGAVILSTPLRLVFRRLHNRICESRSPFVLTAYAVLIDLATLAALGFSVLYIIGGSYNPFIYFRF